MSECPSCGEAMTSASRMLQKDADGGRFLFKDAPPVRTCEHCGATRKNL